MKGFAHSLAVLMLAVAPPVHAQSQERPVSGDIQRPMQALDPLEGPLPVEARQTLARYGACVAERSPEKARAILLADFRTTQYRIGLRTLSENNRDCFGRRGKMRSSNLLFAGAIAEQLLKSGDGLLKVRLARAAAGNAPASFGATDQIAQCVVRSVPDDVSSLFATEVTTDAETNALRALEGIAGRCAQGRQLETNPGGLRAILATAAFRNVEAAK